MTVERYDWGTAGGGGGTSDVYSNAVAMPTTVGGWDAGSTFADNTMTEMWDGLLYSYQFPAFTAFAISGQTTTLEVGDAIAIHRTFTWATSNSANVATNSISLTDTTGGTTFESSLANDGSQATSYPASPLTKSSATTNVFTIAGQNTHSQTFSKTYTVTWQWRRFYGESASAGPLDEAAVEALRVSGLVSGFAGAYAFVGGGYKYIAYPTALGTATVFKDASTNFDVPFESPNTVSITNAFGVTATYRVHRTTNVLLGSITINVS